MNQSRSCPICQEDAFPVACRKGVLPPHNSFSIYNCSKCRFSFIPDYRRDFDILYSKEYYQGKGADALVNYQFEIENFQSTIRHYEWSGIVDVFRHLTDGQGKWLDYGCGMGGLVKFSRDAGCNIWGYENSSNIGMNLVRGGILLNDEQLYDTQWDFITAIEVLEHIPNPLEILRRMRSLLKPGGKVFFTTGNAKPWRGKLDAWAYTSVPDVHISFFEPKTLALALKKTEFNAEFPGYISGFSNIIKYKILKTLKIKYRSKCIDLLPWNSIAKIVNYKYKVSSMPIGIAV